MAELRPLCAWRYDPDVVGDIRRLMSPLDDEPTARRLHYRIAEHALHLAEPRSVAQAVDRWQRWQRLRVVRRDPLPALYAYSQTYTRPGHHSPTVRQGLIGRLALDSPEAPPSLLPHEGTLDAGVVGLLTLQQATQLQVTPVHALYRDPSQCIEALIAPALADPFATLTDAAGVTHRLGLVQHVGLIQALTQALAPHTLILADGHHRLAAALLARDLLTQRLGALPHDHPVGTVLAFCSNVASEANDNESHHTTSLDALGILPFHRVLQLTPDLPPELLLRRLADYFILTPLEARAPLPDVLHAAPHRIALVLARQWHLLTLRQDIELSELLGALPLPASLRALDYTLLHALVFDHIAGIPYAEQRTSARINYFPSATEAIDRALYRPGHAAFLMPEVAFAQLEAVVADRALMPPKSTYFYPKVLAGLLFADLDPSADRFGYS